MQKYILSLTFCVLHFSLFAQSELSLSDAIQVGLKNNFDILIVGKQKDIATKNNTYGNAGAFPSVTIGATQNNTYSDNDNPAAFINGLTESHTITPNANLNWTLFNGFNILSNKRKLELLEQQSFGNANLIVQNTVQAIILAYYQAVVDKENEKVLQQVKDLSRDEYLYAITKSDLGAGTTFDLLQAKDAYLTDSTNFINQQLAYRAAVRTLNTLLATELTNTYILTDSVLPEIEVYDYNVLKDQALANNENIKLAMIDVAIAAQDIRIQQSSLYPSLGLSAGISNQFSNQSIDGTTINGDAFTNDFEARNLTYFANFTLSYQLYNGGKIRTAIANAKAQEEITNLTLEQQKQSIEQELLNAYDDYNSQLQLLGIARESRENAALNLEIGQEKFSSGSVTSFEFRDIQLRYIRSSLNQVSAAYRVVQAKTNLARLTGTILD